MSSAPREKALRKKANERERERKKFKGISPRSQVGLPTFLGQILGRTLVGGRGGGGGCRRTLSNAQGGGRWLGRVLIRTLPIRSPLSLSISLWPPRRRVLDSLSLLSLSLLSRSVVSIRPIAGTWLRRFQVPRTLPLRGGGKGRGSFGRSVGCPVKVRICVVAKQRSLVEGATRQH